MKDIVRSVLAASVVLSLFHGGVGLKLNLRADNATAAKIPIPDVALTPAPSLVLQNGTLHQQPTDLVAGDLVFDFGFYDGRDSNAYCSAGLKVVAVEADPSLVQAAGQNPQFAHWMSVGQLTILNFAIAPADQAQAAWTKFYLNKCSKEWNSFYSGIGCRTCTPPYPESPSSCVVQNVQSTPCAQVIQQFGVPKYFKLDIEGAESGCYEALKTLPVTSRPLFISGEVGNGELVDWLSGLGYKSFKLVQQQSGHSGVWGNNAHDCRAGRFWRSLDGARQELQAIFKKGPVPGDVCPGSAVGGVWYDIHASMLPHQTW